jgi:hypothetical protein
MEERLRKYPVLWIGGALFALLVIGTLIFGATRLYALGWARGAAMTTRGEIREARWVMPAPLYHGYRRPGHPLLLALIVLLVIGAVLRHRTWRMHPPRPYWPHRHAPGTWHHRYPGYPGCDPTYPQADASADVAPEEEMGGAA